MNHTKTLRVATAEEVVKFNEFRDNNENFKQVVKLYADHCAANGEVWDSEENREAWLGFLRAAAAETEAAGWRWLGHTLCVID